MSAIQSALVVGQTYTATISVMDSAGNVVRPATVAEGASVNLTFDDAAGNTTASPDTTDSVSLSPDGATITLKLIQAGVIANVNYSGPYQSGNITAVAKVSDIPLPMPLSTGATVTIGAFS